MSTFVFDFDDENIGTGGFEILQTGEEHTSEEAIAIVLEMHYEDEYRVLGKVQVDGKTYTYKIITARFLVQESLDEEVQP